jgi:hypothetical protein
MSQSDVITPKRLMLAQISICDGCCCGKMDKGHPEVPVQWLKQEWKVRAVEASPPLGQWVPWPL